VILPCKLFIKDSISIHSGAEGKMERHVPKGRNKIRESAGRLGVHEWPRAETDGEKEEDKGRDTRN